MSPKQVPRSNVCPVERMRLPAGCIGWLVPVAWNFALPSLKLSSMGFGSPIGVRVAENDRGAGRIAVAVDDRERAAQGGAVPRHVDRLVEVAVVVRLADRLVAVPGVEECIGAVEIGRRRAKEREARPEVGWMPSLQSMLTV